MVGWPARDDAAAYAFARFPSTGARAHHRADLRLNGDEPSARKSKIEGAFQTVINQYEALFTNNVTVTITLDLSIASARHEHHVPDMTTIGTTATDQYRTIVNATRRETGRESVGKTELSTLPTGPGVPVNSAADATTSMELSLPTRARWVYRNVNPPSGQDRFHPLCREPATGVTVQFATGERPGRFQQQPIEWPDHSAI